MKKLTERQKQNLYDEVLVLLNKALTALGRHPLDGIPAGLKKQNFYCPISIAFDGCETGQYVIQFNSESDAKAVQIAWNREPLRIQGRVSLPMKITKFIEHFDNGHFPELELMCRICGR